MEEFEDEDVEDAELKDDEDEGSKKSKKRKEKKGCKDIDNKRKMKPAVGTPVHNRHKAVEITANSLKYMSLYPYLLRSLISSTTFSPGRTELRYRLHNGVSRY